MQNGMAREGGMPQDVYEWLKRVKEMTMGKGGGDHRTMNSVIMGRKTYEYFCQRMDGATSLPGRMNYVISSKLNQAECADITIYKDLGRCLAGIGNLSSGQQQTETWILGGEMLFKEALSDYLPYCNRVYICRLVSEAFACDQFFPMDILKTAKRIDETKTALWTISCYTPHVVHQEIQYTDLLKSVLDENKVHIAGKNYMCGTNKTLSFDLGGPHLPVITTREIDIDKIQRDIVEDLRNKTFSEDSVGFRLRTTTAFEKVREYSEPEDGIDGIERFIDLVRSESKGGVISSVLYLNRDDFKLDMPTYVVLTVPSNRSVIDAQVVCARMEIVEAFPNLLTYFAILVNILAKVINANPRQLSFHFSQCLIDCDHHDIATRQSLYDPKPFPKLRIKTANIRQLSELDRNDLSIVKYDKWVKYNLNKRVASGWQ